MCFTYSNIMIVVSWSVHYGSYNTSKNWSWPFHYSFVIQYHIEQFIDGVSWYTKCTVSQNTISVSDLQQLQQADEVVGPILKAGTNSSGINFTPGRDYCFAATKITMEKRNRHNWQFLLPCRRKSYMTHIVGLLVVILGEDKTLNQLWEV